MTEQIDLMKLVIEEDDKLIQEGEEPFRRSFKAYIRISQRLNPGCNVAITGNELSRAIQEIYKNLYRPTDLHMPPMHVGAFMFRDVFFSLRVPVIFGSHVLNPIDLLIDATDFQKAWLFNDRQTELTYIDQFIDLIDFIYSLDDLEKMDTLPKRTIEWWYMAKYQLEAAAATVIGSFSKYVVIQNCCISTELLLKGALLARGVDEDTLKDQKKYGHKLENLVSALCEIIPKLDKPTLVSVVSKFPNYVKSRYDAVQVPATYWAISNEYAIYCGRGIKTVF